MNLAELYPKPRSNAAKRLTEMSVRFNQLRAEAREACERIGLAQEAVAGAAHVECDGARGGDAGGGEVARALGGRV